MVPCTVYPEKSHFGRCLCRDFAAKVVGFPSRSSQHRRGEWMCVCPSALNTAQRGLTGQSEMPGEPGREGGCPQQLLKEAAPGDRPRPVSACRHGEGHLARGTSVFGSKEVQNQGGRKHLLHVRDKAVGCVCRKV